MNQVTQLISLFDNLSFEERHEAMEKMTLSWLRAELALAQLELDKGDGICGTDIGLELQAGYIVDCNHILTEYDLSHVVISPAARKALFEIRDYIAALSGDAVLRWLENIPGKFETLLAFPQLGRLRTEVMTGLRSMPDGEYEIFYRHTDAEFVEIVQVLHMQRELGKINTGDIFFRMMDYGLDAAYALLKERVPALDWSEAQYALVLAKYKSRAIYTRDKLCYMPPAWSIGANKNDTCSN